MPKISRRLAKPPVMGPGWRGSTRRPGYPRPGPDPQGSAHRSTCVPLHPPANVLAAACRGIKAVLVQPSATPGINLKATAVLPDEGRGSPDRSCPEAVWACEGWGITPGAQAGSRFSLPRAVSSFQAADAACSSCEPAPWEKF